MNFQTVLAKHRELSFSEHDKGNRFERLMQGFLKTDPIYASQFQTVWMWDEFPYKSQFGGHDVGIDLVGLTYDNEDGDWINPRNPLFDTFIPIGDKKGDEAEVAFFIPIYSRGLSTARDVWCYNSSKEVLIKNINESIIYYNSQVDTFKVAKSQDSKLCVDDLLKYDSTKFSCTKDSDQFVISLQRDKLVISGELSASTLRAINT
ncbi:restriction endonuclease [uncultured Methanocorpusculum sp.]|nr:type ISP restriction/modification enzyme [uncultured Methanocorpusculum sp.]